MENKFLPYGAPDHPSVKPVDLKNLRPYGDAMNDGRAQVSFTLPVNPSPEAEEAARELMRKMGFHDIKVVAMEKPSEGFSFYVCYGAMDHAVDYTKIHVLKVEAQFKSFYEINDIIKKEVGRKIIIVGATTGFDAHTVGIDAIFNMKGYKGDYGLERYSGYDARNLGAQVLNEELLDYAIKEKADAILVSQIVDEKDCHIDNLKELMRLAEQKGLRDHFIFVCGGPRLNHPIAVECGLDAGFGPGTLPSHVASYVLDEFLRRKAAKKEKK
ncbi:MAG TPA: OAM dimerization domain-containing protein [Bdellovibrionota bacterium]|jgi:beta-lysine 5,6-aminomutase beta subunit